MKLSDEGVTVTAIEGPVLRGHGWNMMSDKETPFALDLKNGVLIASKEHLTLQIFAQQLKQGGRFMAVDNESRLGIGFFGKRTGKNDRLGRTQVT